MSEFVLVPALIMGIAIGILEMIFVHADEAGMGWLIHALHALPVTMFFVFASMNISWVLALLNMEILSVWYVDLGIRILIGIIAMVKIAGAAAIAGKVGERWYHTLIIGGIIVVAPYIWDLIGPLIMPTLPAFLQ